MNAGDGTVTCLLRDANGLAVSQQTAVGEDLPRCPGMEAFDVGATPSIAVAGDFDGDGFSDVVMAVAGSGTLMLCRGGAHGLSLAQPIDETGLCHAIAMHVVAGESRDDLVVADAVGGQLHRFRGGPDGLSADGTSSLPDTRSDGFPRALASGDYNGDGEIDLAVVLRESFELFWFGGGRFDDPHGPIDIGERPVALVAADYDGDGFTDVVTVNAASDSLNYLRGGKVGLTSLGEISVGASPQVAITEDLDLDGVPDIVVANAESADITFLRGERGGLEFTSTRPTRRRPRAAVSADFDGDGFDDLVVANAGSASTEQQSRITIHNGVPNGFAEGRELPIPANTRDQHWFPSSMALGDFNGDKQPDVVAANENSDNLTLHAGGPEENPGLSEGRAVELSGDLPVSLLATDLDGDRATDLLVGFGRSARVDFLQGGGGFPGRARSVELDSAPVLAMASGDFDGDGDQDVAVLYRVQETREQLTVLTVLTGQSAEAPSEADYELVETGPVADGGLSAIVAADFDGDGLDDIIVADAAADRATWFRGTAARAPAVGGLERVGGLATGQNPTAIVSGDFDGDAYPDAVTVESGSLTLIRGGPAGPVAPRNRDRLPLAVSGHPSTGTADYDGDGFLDLVVIQPEGGAISLFRGSVEGLVAGATHTTGSIAPDTATRGDFNGDGFPDLAVLNAVSDDVAVFLQLFRVPHANTLVAPGTDLKMLEDPRSPSRYTWIFESGVSVPTQVCVTPALMPRLPQNDARAAGHYLAPLTDAVAVLSDRDTIGDADLILRVREGMQQRVDDGPIRVFRRDTDAAGPAELISSCELMQDPLSVCCPVSREGIYVAVVETRLDTGEPPNEEGEE